ncbi:MAG TPA: ThuA domain-containing protein, partial [Ktedonobacterales bacterium]|nr:ThuA domain-containing protein [Ktedonobacterales bacterium]
MAPGRWRSNLMLLTLALVLLLGACGGDGPGAQKLVPTRAPCAASARVCPARLLVFSKTADYRHSAIPVAQAAIRQMVAAHGWAADFTEDASAFTDERLARFDAVVFLLTTGDVLDAEQQSAFERYIRAGGGFVGVHSASDTEYDWAWYGGLVGAHNNQLRKHSGVTQGTLVVADPAHPSTRLLPARWTRVDEWYNFATNPRPHVHVLLTLDETTYQGGTMGPDHPIAWYHAYE